MIYLVHVCASYVHQKKKEKTCFGLGECIPQLKATKFAAHATSSPLTLDMVQLEHGLPITLDLIIHVFALKSLHREHSGFGQHGDIKVQTKLIFKPCCKRQGCQTNQYAQCDICRGWEVAAFLL